MENIKRKTEIKEKKETGLPAVKHRSSPPSAAQHEPNATTTQSSPAHVTIRIKKKKTTFFFFPETDTEEELAGHVFVADKDDPGRLDPAQHSIEVAPRPYAPFSPRFTPQKPRRHRRVSEPVIAAVPPLLTISCPIK
jgi:hypothetical protein